MVVGGQPAARLAVESLVSPVGGEVPALPARHRQKRVGYLHTHPAVPVPSPCWRGEQT